MATETIDDHALDAVRQALLSHPAIAAAYLLGSAVTGRLRSAGWIRLEEALGVAIRP